MSQIHPTAVIDPSAELDKDVTVGPYSIVGSGVRLERGVKIASHAVVEGNTEIGEGTEIFQFASIGSAPQDLKYHGEDSRLVIGQKNIIREYVTIQPGTEGGGMLTSVGNGNLFMANSHVAHDCILGDGNILANSVALAGHINIGNRVIFGGLSAVHQFLKIGDYAMLSGGSMVVRDIAPYCMVQGDRAGAVGINKVGLKRAGFSSEVLSKVSSVYKQLFNHSGSIVDKAKSLVSDHSDCKEVMLMLEFILSSEKGITLSRSEISE